MAAGATTAPCAETLVKVLVVLAQGVQVPTAPVPATRAFPRLT